MSSVLPLNVLLVILLTIPSLCDAATYYVAPDGIDTASGLTLEEPLATPQAAINQAIPGDTILLRGGVYPAGSGSMAFKADRHRGSDQAWLTIKNYPGEEPVLRWDRAHAHFVGIWLTDAAYVEISGLTLEGWMDELTLDEAKADAKALRGSTIFNAGGIQADGRDTKKITRTDENRPHHFRIIGNTIRKFPGGGISFIQCDDLLVQNNTVEDCCWYTIWAGSGISIWQSWSLGPPTDDYRIRVIGNRLFGNKTLVEWASIGSLSDGNGIIIDDFRNTQNKSQRGTYNGHTLVANNLVVNNGGSGIHSFLSNNVDIVHNTAYHNGQVLDYGEIFALNSDHVRIIDNICVARPDRVINKLSKACTNVDYRGNLYCGGYLNAAYYSANNITGEPLFLNPSIDPTTADFRLGAASPALDAALTENAGVHYPWVSIVTNDISGAPRVNGPRADLGAYERNGPALPTTGLVLTGNGEPILNGDTATSPDNRTAFPATEIGIPMSEDAVHEFKLTNRDTINQTISALALTGSPAFAVVDSPHFPIVLAPGKSTILKFAFKPLTPGNQSALIALTGSAPFSFAISGKGEALPHVLISVASLTATLPVKTTITHPGLVLTNSGTATLTWSIATSSPNVELSQSSGSLDPGQRRKMPVAFNSAQQALGKTEDSTLTLTTNDPKNLNLILPVHLVVGTNIDLSPTISLTAPSRTNAVQKFGATVELTASATKIKGTVAKVDFYDGETLLATAATEPYTCKWTPETSGLHRLSARATDNLGTVALSQSVMITVVNVPPKVELTTPIEGKSLTSGTPVTLAASATAPDGKISRVEFYASGVLIGTAINEPYTASWTPYASGPKALYAKAYDASGTAATSAPVNIGLALPPIPSDGLVASWPFNEGTGTTSEDLSGHDHSATLADAAWTPSGQFGAAVSFDGSPSGKITFDHPALGAFSFSAWIKGSTGGAASPVILSLPGSGPDGKNGYTFVFRRKDPSKPRYDGLGFLDGTGGNWQTYGNLDLGTWYHIAITFDGAANSSGLTIYVNGIARKDTTNYGVFNGEVPSIPISTPELPGIIGNEADSSRPLAACIDQARLYDRALSPAEVTALFLDGGLPETTKPQAK